MSSHMYIYVYFYSFYLLDWFIKSKFIKSHYFSFLCVLIWSLLGAKNPEQTWEMQILHAFVKQRFSVGIVSQIAVPLLQLVRNLDRAV